LAWTADKGVDATISAASVLVLLILPFLRTSVLAPSTKLLPVAITKST
jgi:hypothetical protein